MIAADDDDDVLESLPSVEDLFDRDDADAALVDEKTKDPMEDQVSGVKRPRVHWEKSSSTPKLIIGPPPRPPPPPPPSSIAESRLREVLGALSAQNTRHLAVSIPLFGTVDLGKVLTDQKFIHIESVTFVAGGITRIVGVPDSVVHLECSGNDLSAASLLDLGPHLQILVAQRNRIAGDVCVAHLASLRHLNLEHNAVERFVAENNNDDDENENENEAATEFPSALETLIVSHNRLSCLNLLSCPGLRRLEACFNTRPFLVTNAPPTLMGQLLPDGAVIKYAPAVPTVDATVTLPEGVVRHSHTFLEKGTTKGGDAPSSSSSSGKKRPQEELLRPMQMPADYERNVERFFSEKATYEAHAMKERRAVVKKGGTWTGPTCPHCERPGGMLFSGKDQKYTARCLSADPATCPFRAFTMNRGCFVSLRAHATRLRSRVIAARESMIKLQYDALLGYLPTDGLAKQFPDQVARYNGLLAQFETFQRRADECFFSTVRADRRMEMRREIDRLVAEVRELLANGHWAEAARLQSGEIRAISDQQGKETYPGRGFLIEYEKPDKKEGVLAFQVLPNVHALADTQFNVGAPL